MSGTNLRFINTLILISLCIIGITGLYVLVWPLPSVLFEIHRAAGWALIALIPWKTVISLRSLSRGLDRRLDRNVMIIISLVLSVVTLTVLVLGLMWKWNLGQYYVWIGGYGYTAIGWHWGIALYLSPLFALHIWRRWLRPKKTDFLGRRQALKLIGLGVVSVAGWGFAETLARALQDDESPRRFTGSREAGSFAGNDCPVTTAPGQGRIKLDPSTWKLTLKGAVKTPLALNYSEVLALSSSEITATLDCTGGWYSTQIWRGIRLTDLLNQAGIREDAIGIVLKGTSEYTAYYTITQAEEILLATHVGDQVLDHRHGYPLRAVVPSRRGWQWVKWLTEIEVVSMSRFQLFTAPTLY